MEVLLNPELNVRYPKISENEKTFDNLIKVYTYRKKGIINNNLYTNSKETCFHDSYAQYLYHCWGTHLGAVIRPEILWFIICSQLAYHVREHAQLYVKFKDFLDPDKQKLMFISKNPEQIEVQQIIELLKLKVPSIDISLLTPEFTTSTQMSKMAVASTFCDNVEAYSFGKKFKSRPQGISKIALFGTSEDYLKLADHSYKMGKIFSLKENHLTNIANRCKQISDFIQSASLTKKDTIWKQFWKDFLYLKGDQMTGWITTFYLKDTNSVAHINELCDARSVSHINLETKREFSHNFGFFSSKVISKYLVPKFEKITTENE